MFEEAVLAEQFEALLAKAQQAERMYDSLASSAPNPDLRLAIEQFRRDKQRHVELAQRLLEIVE